MEDFTPLYILASDKYIFNLNPKKHYDDHGTYGRHTLLPLDRRTGKTQFIEIFGEYGDKPSFPVAPLDQVMHRLDEFNSNIVFTRLIRVTIPPDATFNIDEIGHHDGSSNFSI